MNRLFALRAAPALALGAAALATAGAALAAAALTPNSGAMTFSGVVRDNDGRQGQFSITSTLADGDFRGTLRLTLGDQSFEGPLMPQRSYLENGKCYFRAENGRARAELGGPCDSQAISGKFETFLPGDGMRNGAMEGQVQTARAAAPAAKAAVLPTVKLTCAYQDRRIGVGAGVATEYSLAYSTMVTLTLTPAGAYTAGKSSGRFTRSGDKIRLTSGTWAGATGTLAPDRSGRPSVVFNIEENRRPGGVHIIDPYTTRCTQAR